MTSRDHSLPDDATLVAWLDGELPATEVSALSGWSLARWSMTL